MRQRHPKIRQMHDRRWGVTAAAVAGILFGLFTVFGGGRALFSGTEVRAAFGDAVPFVLWFNFLAGFVYVVAGLGLYLRKSWSARLSIAILLATILVMIAFGIHLLLGGSYEMRTVWAMSLRTIIWSIIAGVAVSDADGFGHEGGDELP